MNGAHFTIGVAAALAALAGTARRESRSPSHGSTDAGRRQVQKQGSRATASPGVRQLCQEQARNGLWVRVYLQGEVKVRAQMTAVLISDPTLVLRDPDEDHESVHGIVICDETSTFGPDSVNPLCMQQLARLERDGTLDGLYIVGQASLDEELQGRGLGLAMYDVLVRVAWRHRYGISPHWCATFGSVSRSAMRTWAALAARHAHVGDPDYSYEDQPDGHASGRQVRVPLIVWGGR